jgi:hypothetical protein
LELGLSSQVLYITFYEDYVIGIFSIAVIFFSYLFNKLELQFIGEFIGFLSLISEVLYTHIKSLLMLPQVIENCKQKRVKGLSHLLVGLNNVGDLMKLAFFIVNVRDLV